MLGFKNQTKPNCSMRKMILVLCGKYLIFQIRWVICITHFIIRNLIKLRVLLVTFLISKDSFSEQELPRAFTKKVCIKEKIILHYILSKFPPIKINFRNCSLKNIFLKLLPQKLHSQSCFLKNTFKITYLKNAFLKFKRTYSKLLPQKIYIFLIAPSKNTLLNLIS